MRIEQPNIESTVDASISQMIVDQKLYDSGWIYNFFCNAIFNKETRNFSFDEHKFFWNDGIHLKRYFEYPWNENTTTDQIFKFITSFLEKKCYVVNYLNDFKWDGTCCKPEILFYNYYQEETQFEFCCWDYNDQIHYKKARIQDICQKIWMDEITNEQKLRFDMLQNVPQTDYCINVESIKRKLQAGIMRSLKYKYYIKKMDDIQIKHSIKVFSEWFAVFKKRADYLGKTNELQGLCDEFNARLMKNDSKEKLLGVLKCYNKLCEQLSCLL